MCSDSYSVNTCEISKLWVIAEFGSKVHPAGFVCLHDKTSIGYLYVNAVQCVIRMRHAPETSYVGYADLSLSTILITLYRELYPCVIIRVQHLSQSKCRITLAAPKYLIIIIRHPSHSTAVLVKR